MVPPASSGELDGCCQNLPNNGLPLSFKLQNYEQSPSCIPSCWFLDAPFLEMFMARLNRTWSNLVFWKMSLPWQGVGIRWPLWSFPTLTILGLCDSYGDVSFISSFQDRTCMSAGLRTPKRYQLLISNTAFRNFDVNTCTAIRTCSGCYQGQGESDLCLFIRIPKSLASPSHYKFIVSTDDHW